MSLLLRPWSVSDAAGLYVDRVTSPDLDRQFADDILSVEEAEQYIPKYLPFSKRAKNWALIVDDMAVGNIGLSDINPHNESAWAFYWLAAGAREKGYAARGLATVADWAFRNGLYRLELGHRTNNPESCRVATRAGFLVEGLEREKLKYGSERFDVELHSRLATDPNPEIELIPIEVTGDS